MRQQRQEVISTIEQSLLNLPMALIVLTGDYFFSAEWLIPWRELTPEEQQSRKKNKNFSDLNLQGSSKDIAGEIAFFGVEDEPPTPHGKDLRHFNFTRSNLSYENLELAFLMYANLTDTILIGTNLYGATTTGANFDGTILTEAKMSIPQAIAAKTINYMQFFLQSCCTRADKESSPTEYQKSIRTIIVACMDDKLGESEAKQHAKTLMTLAKSADAKSSGYEVLWDLSQAMAKEPTLPPPQKDYFRLFTLLKQDLPGLKQLSNGYGYSLIG